MNYPRNFTIAILLLLFPYITYANQTDAKQLHKLLSAINTFVTQFDQQVLDEKGKEIQRFTGDMAVKKPGRLRWQANEPVQQTVVTNNVKLFFYDADLEQLTVQTYTEDLSQTPALLLGGDIDKLESSFRIEAVNVSATTNKANPGLDQVTYELFPLNKESLFEKLSVSFTGSQINQLTMLDSLSQLTIIKFQNMVVNTQIADETFEFKAPPGTDILINE